MTGVFEGLSEEQLRILQSDPRQYASNFWRHPHDPERRYDFYDTNQNYKLNYLLHDDGPLNPENWGDINVLKFARGCLKSTTMRIISSWAMHMFLHKGLEIYMTAPREDQITNLTDDLDKNIQESGLDAYREKDNQMFQKFEIKRKDERGNTFPVHTKFEADSGWGEGDALRGPHSHMGIIDEFQDISKAAFDTYQECIDQELKGINFFPCIFVLGTPKLTSSFYHELWQKTDKRKWNEEERRWIQQDDPETYLPDDVDEDEMTQAEIEEMAGTVRGWHLDQPNCPLHDDIKIAKARDNYSEMKFQNEVLANFYSPEDNLLSREHVEACFDPELGFVDSPREEDTFVTLAVDFGGGSDRNAADTVVSVFEHFDYDDSTESIMLNIDFLSGVTRLETIRRIEEWLADYDVDTAVIDYGHSEGIMEDLQDGNNTIDDSGYIDTVKACRFGNIRDKTDIKWENSSGKRRFFTADKTRVTTRMVDAVKQQEFTIPTQDLSFTDDSSDGVKLINQLTAAHKVLKTTPSGTKKVQIDKDDNRNDDAMDNLTYQWIALNELGPQNSVTTVRMNRRAGYR